MRLSLTNTNDKTIAAALDAGLDDLTPGAPDGWSPPKSARPPLKSDRLERGRTSSARARVTFQHHFVRRPALDGI